MVEWALFYFSLPLILRLKNRQIALFQDFFISIELALIVTFLPFLGSLLGFFAHLYLALDYVLYKKMGLRLRFSHFSQLRNLSHLYISAKGFGVLSLFWWGLGLMALHGIHAYFSFPPSFSWVLLGLLAGVGILAVGEKSYALENPLFYEQKRVFRFRCQRPRTAPPSFPLVGPKLSLDVSDKPHIVFLFLESFRMGSVNPEITPHFSKLIPKGLFFSQFYANGTLTYRAYISSLFGIPPGKSTRRLAPYVQAPLKGIPEMMKREGYRTAFHHNGSFGFDQQREFLERHFEELVDRFAMEGDKVSGWGIEDERLMRYSADWLEKQTKPSFLTLFTISNHHPWILPPAYAAPSFGFPSPREQFSQTMHYTDHSLGLFIDLLREKNLDRKTILFVLGDHGQPMGEHFDNFYNSRFLYEENIHIPLLILAEGRVGVPKKIDSPSSHLDLLPTLMDLFDLNGDVPRAGTSLLRPIPNRTIFFQNPYSEGFSAARKGEWKWIKNHYSGGEELYNLDQDPKETNNLAAVQVELAIEMQKETENFFDWVYAFYKTHKAGIPKIASELDVSNQLLTDQQLLDQATPALRLVSLDHCHLLTDGGISALFEKCPYLEGLSLRGLSGLSGQFLQQAMPRYLRWLDCFDGHRVSDEGLFRLAHHCPSLKELVIQGHNLTDRGLGALGPGIIRLKLYHAPLITEEGMIAFLRKNPHLIGAVFSNCIHFTDRVAEALKTHYLERLWIEGESGLTQQGVANLEKLPIRSLIIRQK